MVLTSTMVVQATSLDEILARCSRLGVPVVAGGPYPSISPARLTGMSDNFIGNRRQVRRLPAEYRPLGVLELQILRQRLDDLLPRPAAEPVLA